MNKKYNDLDIRMKDYEYVTRNYLTKRLPVIIRIDGKSFHTFTKGFKRPFDKVLSETMRQTMNYLCENIQGCVLGYTQSDEISLLLVDYKTMDSQPWFNNNIQKIASISASMATLAFNRYFEININEIPSRDFIENGLKMNDDKLKENINETVSYIARLKNALNKGAMFDSRVFTIPKEEVINYFIWRQQDATRNSIQMVGRANFSNKQLQNKKTNEIQDMLFIEKGINWNNIPTIYKRGSCCIKKERIIEDTNIVRSYWDIDNEIPIFTQNKEYINKLVFV